MRKLALLLCLALAAGLFVSSCGKGGGAAQFAVMRKKGLQVACILAISTVLRPYR